MTLHIVLNMDNDAFLEDRDAEASRILKRFVDEQPLAEGRKGLLLDRNGNTAGEWSVS